MHEWNLPFHGNEGHVKSTTCVVVHCLIEQTFTGFVRFESFASSAIIKMQSWNDLHHRHTGSVNRGDIYVKVLEGWFLKPNNLLNKLYNNQIVFVYNNYLNILIVNLKPSSLQYLLLRVKRYF